MNSKLAMHETLDLHELINLKGICAAKSSAMMMMVSDPQLKNMLQQDIQMSTQHAQQLRNLLSGANGGSY